MTTEDFIERVKADKGNDGLSYALAVLLIFFGLVMFALCIHSNKNTMPSFLGASCFIVMGCYVIWRIPKQYEIKCIDWVAPQEVKMGAIENYLKVNDMKIDIRENNFIQAYYTTRWLRFMALRIYVNGEGVYINALSLLRRGPIDLGQSKRAVKDLEDYLISKS